MTTNAESVIQGVLYSVLFEMHLDEKPLARIAQFFLEGPSEPLLGNLTPQEGYTALVEALGSSVKLTELLPISPPVHHSEQKFRDFLQRLLERLDAMRPWPELPYRYVDISTWSTFATARPVARIGMSDIKAQLHRIFHYQAKQGEKEVVILRLRSGDEVALVTPWWPKSRDVALLQRDPHRSPQQVVTEFLNATGFPPEAVTVLS